MKPYVSIGLPVYNGENYIVDAVRSVLDQTFTDFEIVISDNASTDRTPQICSELVKSDPRIRYFRSDHNYGSAWNFNQAFKLSSGKYFKWLAHDDLIAPDYLKKCVEVLDQNPSVVLCYTGTAIIDENKNLIEEYPFWLNTNSPQPHQRFRDLVLEGHKCFEIFGLMRSSELRKTGLMGSYGHADAVLLGWLSLLGSFYKVPETLFFARQHAKQSMKLFDVGNPTGRPDYHAYTEWFDTSKKGKLIFPNWKIISEYLKVVWKSPVNGIEKGKCYWTLARWTKRHWRYLINDLDVAVNRLRVNRKKTPLQNTG